MALGPGLSADGPVPAASPEIGPARAKTLATVDSISIGACRDARVTLGEDKIRNGDPPPHRQEWLARVIVTSVTSVLIDTILRDVSVDAAKGGSNASSPGGREIK